MTVQEVFALVDPTLDLGDLEALAADCPLPIMLKGVQTGADAALAVEHGAGGGDRLQPRRAPARRRPGDRSTSCPRSSRRSPGAARC